MTFNEAVGVHACDIDNETGKRLTFRELNIRYIKQLGGLDVVKKYIPFELDYLLPRYREDKYFNNTWLATWMRPQNELSCCATGIMSHAQVRPNELAC